MTAEVLTFPGAVPLPVAQAEPVAPVEKDLNDPRYWIEPSVAPMIVSNLRPRVTVAGGFATILFAVVENSLPYDSGKDDPQATVQAKVIIPAAMLQDYAIALAVAAGGRMVTEKDGGDGGEAH